MGTRVGQHALGKSCSSTLTARPMMPRGRHIRSRSASRVRPHMLEVEFPSDVEQSLGISILEPNAAAR